MNKQIIGATLGVILCAAGCAQGQSHHPTESIMIRNLDPVGPNAAVNEANRKVKGAQIAHLDQAAAAALDMGQYAEAEAAARQSVSLGWSAGKGHEFLAAALDAQGKTQEALQVYKKIAATGDVFQRNELPYSRLLLKTGQWAQAVAAYNRQLLYRDPRDLMLANGRFSPDVPQPRELAAAIHIELGRSVDWKGYHWGSGPKDQALAQFQQALALEPDSALAHYYYGEALDRLGRRAEAKAMLQEVAGTTQGDVREAAEKMLKGF